MGTSIRLRIGPADHGRRMTLDEYIAADFQDGWLYELARGVVDVTEVPDVPHGRRVGRLRRLFVLYDVEHRGIINYGADGATCRVHLPGMQSSRRPDQAVYLCPPPAGGDPWRRWIPQIVVEVVDRGSEDRDYVEKREEYLLAGVTEYWILASARKRMLVLQRAGDVWEEVVVKADEVYDTPLLPGLEVRPGELLGLTP